MLVGELKASDFDSDGNIINNIVNEGKPIILMYKTNYCKPCENLLLILKLISHERDIIVTVVDHFEIEDKLIKIDPGFDGRYPSLLLNCNGKKISYNGYMDYTSVLNFIDEHCGGL